MANIVYIAASLDGFIATKEGGIDWLNELPNPDNDDFGYEAFMENIDALVMGRNTYEKVMSFGDWPYNKKVFVLSNRLKHVDQKVKGRAEVVSGEIKDIASTLSEKGFRNLYIDGGKTVQSFLKENLIDEMIITRIPVVLGDGIPLFGHQDLKINFKHLKTEIFNNGLVQSHYKRA